MQLYFGLSQRLARRCYRGLGIRYDRVEDQVHVTYEVPAEQPGSLGFAHGTLGLLRAYPRLLGLPDAHVQGEFCAHRVLFVVTPPSSMTIGARLAGALGIEGIQVRPGELESCLAMFHDTSAMVERVSELGSALPMTGLSECWEALRALLATEFCCHRARCYLDAKGSRVLVGETGNCDQGRGHTRMLVVSGQRVGELWMDLSEEDPMLPLLVPWVAIALQGAARAEQGYGRTPSPETHKQAWRLTTRQGQVLELVARGCTNKEVATALHCSPRTVDVIVSQLLERTACPNRSSLVARYWSGRR
jgi:DNA-binding CsgD family transcriptional regulator